MLPKSGGHSVLAGQFAEGWACRWMLRRQEKVIVFMKKSLVESDKCLPLLVAEVGFLAGLLLVNLHTFLFHHHKSSIYSPDLINQLIF